MKLDIYNQSGDKYGKAELADGIFGLKTNADLIHQVVVSQMSNKRQGNANAKDRSEVRGGGRKPWKQKGTGRARHGSRRSPIWKGGGITFGPRSERDYKKVIPIKMRKKALAMVLSAKAGNNLLIIADSFKLETPKTKAANAFLSKLPIDGSCLIITEKNNPEFYRAARNIAGVSVMEARNLTALDAMSFKYTVVENSAIKPIEEMLSLKKIETDKTEEKKPKVKVEKKKTVVNKRKPAVKKQVKKS